MISMNGGTMKQVLEENLIYEILSVVEEIPDCSIATYGQIARLIGRDKNSKTCWKSPQQGRILWRLSLS